MATQLHLGVERLSSAELDFLDYFSRIPQACLAPVEHLYRGAGPRGFGVSLFLARMLKVKEGIASDRELCERLGRIRLYQLVCRLDANQVPAVSTFSEFRDRLGAIGYRDIHNRFVEHAHSLGLLAPALRGLPRNRREGIILIADSTFLLTAGCTQGEKQPDGTWKFTDPTARFGRRHHHHRYAVGHRCHSLVSVSGIPLVSRVVGANEADVTQVAALVGELHDRYPRYQFAYLILDAGYDAEEAYRLAFEEFGIIPVVIQVKEARARKGFTRDWRPLCPFNFVLRRTGIDYARRRTRWACFKVCRSNPQLLLFDCEHGHTTSDRGLVRYTHFRDSYRTFGPAAPNTQIYEFLKSLRTGIERTYGLVKENRYRLEANNTYVGADNVLLHVLEHDIVMTHDIINDYLVSGKMSPVLDVKRTRGRDKSKPWSTDNKKSKPAATTAPSEEQLPPSQPSTESCPDQGVLAAPNAPSEQPSLSTTPPR